ncbi:MAG: hypothetical protein JJ939_16065 [Alphaproteobacteria bacterium]|nr:hypothetical protein [Alphaproteobacteria bacterium]MBO6629930.1 hypothetical protein [Alphaproteobacteria bacterium]
MRVAKIRWTDEEDMELTKGIKLSKSYSVISREMGRSRSACIGRAYRLGLCAKAPAPPIAALERSVSSYHEIAVRSFRGDCTQHAMEAVLVLEKNECSWPIGHPTDEGFHFCRAQVSAEGGSYCAVHRATALLPAIQKEVSA